MCKIIINLEREEEAVDSVVLVHGCLWCLLLLLTVQEEGTVSSLLGLQLCVLFQK